MWNNFHNLPSSCHENLPNNIKPTTVKQKWVHLLAPGRQPRTCPRDFPQLRDVFETRPHLKAPAFPHYAASRGWFPTPRARRKPVTIKKTHENGTLQGIETVKTYKKGLDQQIFALVLKLQLTVNEKLTGILGNSESNLLGISVGSSLLLFLVVLNQIFRSELVCFYLNFNFVRELFSA